MRDPSERRPLKIADHAAFRRFWYPIARSDAPVAGELVPRRLLGVDLVLWRGGDGGLNAADGHART